MKKLFFISILFALSCKKEKDIKVQVYGQPTKANTTIEISYNVGSESETMQVTYPAQMNKTFYVPDGSKYSIKVRSINATQYQFGIGWIDTDKNQKSSYHSINDGKNSEISGRIN